MSSSSTPPLPPLPPPRLFYHPAFWCHNCDMSIALPPSPTPTALLCPHCHRDSLEQMDHHNHHDHNHNQNDGNTLTSIDDNFLLSSPYLHRLIDHLTDVPAPIVANPRSDPVPRAVIDSLPVVSFDAEESDLSLCCAVCKDQFVVESVGKVMPCKHVYHSDCIVPWLEINNSCPVCRFKLPVFEEEKGRKGGGGGSREEDEEVELGFDELMEDEVELFGFRNTLRRIARSHRRGWDEEGAIGGGSEGELFSPTQIGEVERGGGVLERQNSVETVSSWPRWQVDEGVGGGGGGGGVSDDGDALHRM